MSGLLSDRSLQPLEATVAKMVKGATSTSSTFYSIMITVIRSLVAVMASIMREAEGEQYLGGRKGRHWVRQPLQRLPECSTA